MRRLILMLAFAFVLGGASIIAFFYVPMPQAAIKSIVGDYPEYFLNDRAFFSTRFSIPEKIMLRAFDLKLQRDWSRHVYSSLSENSQDDIIFVRAAVSLVRRMFLTQRHFPQTEIDNTLGVFLVRGYGYCDYINGALARILVHRFNDVALFGAVGLGNVDAQHTVVRIRSKQGTYFADAWSDVAIWGFPDEVNAEYRDRIPRFSDVRTDLRRVLPGTIAENYRQGFVFNRYDWRYRLQKAADRIWLLFTNPTPPQVSISNVPSNELKRNHDSQIKTQKTDLISDSLKSYLEDRVDQIFGYIPLNQIDYLKYSENCHQEFCLAAGLFAQAGAE
jgi:hypothetical protein